MSEIATTEQVWCENVNAPAHGNGKHERQANCGNPRTVGTNFTGTYEVNAIHTSRSSHNGLLVLSGDGLADRSRVYCDTRAEGFDTLKVGKSSHFTFNESYEITLISPLCEGCRLPVNEVGGICDPCRNEAW